jgi:hypothetical protein
MLARLKASRAVLQFLLPLAALAFGSAAAQDKLKVEVVPQLGHSDSVSSVAFSADGSTPCFDLACRIAAKTGCMILTEGADTRLERGAGRVHPKEPQNKEAVTKR